MVLTNTYINNFHAIVLEIHHHVTSDSFINLFHIIFNIFSVVFRQGQ